MSEPDERLARIETKIDYISEDIEEIKVQMGKINGRTNEIEDKNIALEIKTKKNCDSITSLWKKINTGIDAKLTKKNQVAIIVALIAGICSIVVSLIMRFL